MVTDIRASMWKCPACGQLNALYGGDCNRCGLGHIPKLTVKDSIQLIRIQEVFYGRRTADIIKS